MIECDDRHLEMLLDADEDSSRCEEIAAHVDSCSHCQTRLATLVAHADEWQDMKKWLSTDDRLAQDEDHEHWRSRHRPGNRTAWTESMARQLLAAPSHPEMLGRIGRYEVERLIGAGGMGIVFKAYDSELNRPVAIKVLAPYLAGNGSARKRFGREARAAAAVVNEHVVAIHNVESDGESPFLVMQYVAGESLHARLDCGGPLDLLEILRIGMQTAKGLAAAHAQGLIHRDVKPSNILLEETVDRALLTDFGLARAADDASLTHSGYHPGTPQYMSPEQSRGEAVDPRSDLFSLGCVMYAMCTGHSPFRAETTMGVLRRISDEPHRPVRQVNPDVPPWLAAIIDRLLAKDRSERFQSAEEVAETLSQWLAHVQRPDVIPAPPTPKTKTSNHAGSRRGLMKYLLGAAASLLLLFAGVVIVLETGKGTIRIESETNDVPIRISRGDEVIDRLTVSQDGKSIRMSAGQYVVQFDGDVSGLSIADDMVTLQRGETEVARIVQSNTPRKPAIAGSQAKSREDIAEADQPRQQDDPLPQEAAIQERPRQLAADEAKGREELERLATTDPGHIHATARFTQNDYGWKWSLYLPPGKSWKIYCRSGLIPQWQDIQASSDTVSFRITRNDDRRIIDLEAFISPDTADGGKLKLWVEADRAVFQGVEHAVWAIDPQVADCITGKTRYHGGEEYNLGVGRVRTLNAGRSMFRLPFASRRFRQADSHEEAEPVLMPGFCVWVEADPNEAGPSPFPDQQDSEGDPSTTRLPVRRLLWREPPPVKQRGFGIRFNQYANNRRVSPGSEDLEHVVESANFVVRAATREQATAFSNLAEAQLAKLMDQWLGAGVELPPYYVAPPELYIRTSAEKNIGAAGDSSADGSSTHIYLNVPREQIEYVQSRVLPQQIMGLILSAYFEGKTPYWAEGGLMGMLRDEAEQKESMKEAEMNRRAGVLLPLRELLTLTKLPEDRAKLLALPGQSLSFLIFLKSRRGQTQLLPFLRDGRGDGGWAQALKVHYGFNSVEECEAAWLNSISGQSLSLPGNSGAGDRGES